MLALKCLGVFLFFFKDIAKRKWVRKLSGKRKPAKKMGIIQVNESEKTQWKRRKETFKEVRVNKSLYVIRPISSSAVSSSPPLPPAPSVFDTEDCLSLIIRLGAGLNYNQFA